MSRSLTALLTPLLAVLLCGPSLRGEVADTSRSGTGEGSTSTGDDAELKRQLAAVRRLGERIGKLRRESKHRQAVLLAETVLATKQKLLGRGNLEVAASMNTLAELHYATEEYEKALPLLEVAYAVRKTLLGERHPDVIRTQTSLADLLAREGEYEKALGLFKAAVSHQEAIHGAEHPAVATNIESMGFICQELGRHKQALEYLRRALLIRQKLVGAEHPLVARGMASLAVVHEAVGDNEKALELQTFAREMRKKLLGPDHPDVAESLAHLAYIHQSRKDYEAALRFCRSALAVRKMKLGEQAPAVADLLDLQANLLRQTAKLEAAHAAAQSALEMRRRLFGTQHPSTLTSLRTVALVKRAQGERKEAAGLLEEVLTARRRLLGAETPEVLESLDDLISLYQDLGEFQKALPLAKDASYLIRKYLSDDSKEMTARFDTLGRLYEATGRYQGALEAFESALRLYRESRTPTTKETIDRVEQLARIHTAMGNREEALKLHREALYLKRGETGPRTPALITNMLNVASIHESSGDFGKALESYQSAYVELRKLHGDEHPEVVEAMVHLARLYEQVGEHQQALSLCESILAARKKAFGEDGVQVADLLNQCGSLYRKLEKFEKALVSFKTALGIREKQLGGDHPDVGTSMNNLASLLQALGNPFRARTLYDSALRILRKHYGDYHPKITTIQNNLAILLAGLGDRLGARDLLKESMLIEDEVYTDLLSVLPGPRKMDFLAGMESTADIYFSLLLVSSIAVREDSPAKTLEFAWTRKNLLADFALPSKDRVVANESEAVRKLAGELKAARTTLAELTWAPQPYLKIGTVLTRRRELRDQIQRQEIDLSRDSPSFRDAHRRHYVRIDDVLSKLPEDAALIEFFSVRWCDFDRQAFVAPHIFAIALSHANGVRIRDVGKADDVARQVQEFREAMARGRGPNSTSGGGDREPDLVPLRSSGRKLQALLVEPFRLKLEGVKKIYFAPTGALHLLPFDALVTRSGKFLGDEYETHVLCTGKDLLAEVAPPSDVSPMVFAAPDYNAPPDGSQAKASAIFPALPEAEVEANRIADWFTKKLFLKPRVLSGPSAAEGTLKSAGAPGALHLATHSFVVSAPTRGTKDAGELGRASQERLRAVARLFNRTGLALAGANLPPKSGAEAGAGEDGRLSAMEIAGLDLSGTDLVVLSNNETSITDENSGQAAYALCRAFQAAGSPVVIRSLWKLPPEPRLRLLQDFYFNYYQKRLSLPDALRQARRSLRNYVPVGKAEAGAAPAGDVAPYDHPFYWSALVLVQVGP